MSHLLDRGTLLDLKFCTYTFENNTQGKFMLQIAFAQSKHYSDNLSDVIRRNQKLKVESGWIPNGAKPGYMNCPATKTAIPDAERFALIKPMWELMLTRAYRPAEICRVANEEWGFRTRRTRKKGDRPLAVGTLYRIFTDPFYAGIIEWAGRNHVVRDFWRSEFEKYPPRLQAEATARVQNKVGALLADPTMYRTLVNPAVDLRFRRLMDDGSILLVNLAKGQIGEDAAHLLGGLLVSTIGLVAMSRADIRSGVGCPRNGAKLSHYLTHTQ